MSQLAHNLRFALRLLLKQPGLSAISIAALALGIGLTTTMFSIVQGALEDLPFDDPDEIVILERTNPSQGIDEMSVPQLEYLDWRDWQTSFEDIGAFYQGTINVSGTERPIRFNGAFMTPSVFDVIGVQPTLGRLFTAADAEPGAEPVLLLGHDVWRNHFDADPRVIGESVRINGVPGTIIGVMPEGFGFPMAEEAWLPLVIDRASLGRTDGNWVDVVGRLGDGVSMESALAELDGMAERLEREYPETNEGIRGRIQPYARQYIDDDVIGMLWTMQGAVFMVLLIACANVANLLLSRAFDRSKEIAVRTALGAGRWRIIGQFLSEVLVMAAIGGVIGLGIAHVGVTLFNQAISAIEKPYWIDVTIDLPILLFATGLVLAASLLAGAVPAFQVTGANLGDVLKDESRGSSSLRMGRITKGLVIAEIALSCGLLVGAGLMIKSVTQLGRIDMGFATEDIFTARLGLFEGDYPEVEDRRQFFEQLQERLSTIPGAAAATLTNALPGDQRASMGRFAVEGESYAGPEDQPLANYAAVGLDFLETFQAEPIEGRGFTRFDTADSLPVALVNRSFAERYLGDGDPVGRRIRHGREDGPWLTVVGVVPDLYMEGVSNAGQRDPQGVYLPLAQEDMRFVSIAVRARGETMALAGPVRQAIAALDPDLPIYWVQPLSRTIADTTWFYVVFGNLFMAFGLAALFLAAIGLYGVMSFSVQRRTQEVGVRMALGAQARSVLRLVVRQGVVQVIIGLVLGLGLAALAAGGLRIVLFQVDPRDPLVFGGITAVLALTGLIACLVPARRAARIDPVLALRNQ